MNTKSLKIDFQLIKSDPMLMFSMATPILLWLLMDFTFPLVKDLIVNTLSYNIQEHYYQSVVFILPLTPMLFGMVYGFILLDERDQGIITLISVTPYGKSGYLKTRLLIPTILSFVVIISLSILLGLDSQINYLQLVVTSFALSLNAPIVLLFLGAFASNKIEGIAISKAFGLVLMAILIDYILPNPYNWIGAYSPLFWVSKSVFSASPQSVIYLTIGCISHLIMLVLFWLTFNKKSL